MGGPLAESCEEALDGVQLCISGGHGHFVRGLGDFPYALLKAACQGEVGMCDVMLLKL